MNQSPIQATRFTENRLEIDRLKQSRPRLLHILSISSVQRPNATFARAHHPSSMALNSFGVQLDDFLTLDPDLVGQRLKTGQ